MPCVLQLPFYFGPDALLQHGALVSQPFACLSFDISIALLATWMLCC